MAYTNEEYAIINRVYDEFAPQRTSITSARDANPEKWFDYQSQLKALDAQVKSAYEKAIADYRAKGNAAQSGDSTQDFFNQYTDGVAQANPNTDDGLEKLLKDTEELIPPGEGFTGPYDGFGRPTGVGGTVKEASGPRGENLGEIAAEYGGGRTSESKEKPQWLKDIERQVPPGRGFTGPYDQFGNPTGVGGTIKQASQDQSTDYAIATALGGSDEQRQQQTFQAEYDPQKAKTATAAAKAYRTAGATEDPFRSQAAFG
jgi:hypothetical protein